MTPASVVHAHRLTASYVVLLAPEPGEIEKQRFEWWFPWTTSSGSQESGEWGSVALMGEGKVTRGGIGEALLQVPGLFNYLSSLPLSPLQMPHLDL
jgi:hypothetical protein